VGADAADVAAALRRERKSEAPEPAPAGPRRLSDEERHYATLLRLLLDHAAELGFDEAELLDLAPDAEWRALASAVLAAPKGALAVLVDALEGEPQRRLSALANEPRPDLEPPERAPRIFADELRWLRARRDEEERRAVKARIASGDSTALVELQQRLARRASASEVPPR
jgi:hypothetical protein